MTESNLRKLLDEVRRHVEEGAVAIEQQRLAIEQQKRRGVLESQAENLLVVLEKSQELHLLHMDRLLEELRRQTPNQSADEGRNEDAS